MIINNKIPQHTVLSFKLLTTAVVWCGVVWYADDILYYPLLLKSSMNQSISLFLCQRVGGPPEKIIYYIGNTIKQVQYICSVHITHALFFFFLVRLFVCLYSFLVFSAISSSSICAGQYILQSTILLLYYYCGGVCTQK